MKDIIENKSVRFVYHMPYESLFGIPNMTDKYIAIKDDDSTLEARDNLEIYDISVWFSLVETMPIYPWICACLSKKYVLKEHVKIMMETNPLKLRHYIDERINSIFDFYESLSEEDRVTALSLLTFETLLATQILENHKIVNFKQGCSFYPTISKFTSLEEFEQWYNSKIYPYFNDLTIGAYLKEQEQIREQKIRDIITKAESKECQTTTT